jgi:hypothetical protein
VLRPAAEDRLRMWPVSRRMNRTGGGDDPALIAEIAAWGASLMRLRFAGCRRNLDMLLIYTPNGPWFIVRHLFGIELLFKVVEVAPSGDRLIAAADNLAVARAAFDTAVALWPNVAIELRQKARVILDSGSQSGGVIWRWRTLW